MLKISLVPDTNVLISNLDIIKNLYSTNDINILYTINYSKTVLEELDNLKKNKVAARNAIKYIESVSKLFKTEIEGKVDDRKIEVIVEHKEPLKAKNNDDRILNYCLRLENPILLTNDKVLLLKCESNNIKYINMTKKNTKAIIKEIDTIIGFDNDYFKQQNIELLISQLKNAVMVTIEPQIIEILNKELGQNFEMVLNQERTLESYLEFISSNFYLFQKYLPSKSHKLISEFTEAVQTQNVAKIKQMASVICLLFRVKLPEQFL